MKKLLIFFLTLSLLLVCGCSPNNSGVSSVSGNSNFIEFGKKEEAKYLLQIDINPSVIVGYAEDENVVYIASNNADGYELLEKHDAVKILGEPINAAIGTLMTAAHEDGYDSKNFDVAINYVNKKKGDMEKIKQIARDAVKLCDFDIKVNVEDSEINYSTTTGISETGACNVCHGEGIATCKDCNGKGERMVTIQREKEVRNNYVCEVCGGKGWIDDGLHGGKTANCDFCGGLDGKMPSGDFNKNAYDRVIVNEEELRKCDTCDGSGEVVCSECGGN